MNTQTKQRNRILTLDLLRGYFLFVIIVDHVYRFPAGYEILTGKGALWASAAEGFFFVSGLMVGMIRGRGELTMPLQVPVKKLLRRSALLYLWAVGLAIFFTLFVYVFPTLSGLKGGYNINASALEIALRSATFTYSYGWADFLQYYAVYLLLCVPAIWLLRKKLWYVIPLVSTGAWLLYNSNQFFTWQILFFYGAVVGFYFYDIKKYITTLSVMLQKSIKAVIVLLAGLTVLASAIVTFGSEYNSQLLSFYNTTRPYFTKETLPIARLLIFFLWFGGLYIVFNKYQSWLKKIFGGILLYFGQNSLYVYIVQAFVIYFLNLLFVSQYNPIINFAIHTLVLLLIYLAVRTKFLFKIIPR